MLLISIRRCSKCIRKGANLEKYEGEAKMLDFGNINIFQIHISAFFADFTKSVPFSTYFLQGETCTSCTPYIRACQKVANKEAMLFPYIAKNNHLNPPGLL